MNIKHKIEVLGKVGPFALLEAGTRETLAGHATLKTYPFGETVFHVGDAADAMFVIVSGRARVVGIGATGEEVTLALLQTGDVLGITALLSSEPRNASARAADELILLRIARSDFEKVIRRNPAIVEPFRKYVSSMGLQNFLKQYTALETLPAHVLRGLVSEFEERAVRRGELVVRQGDPGDRFYIVRSGSLQALRKDGAAERVVGQMGPGEFFGELALLTGAPRAASVVAVTDGQLYSMGKPGFDRALSSSPAFRARLEERAQLYRSESSAGDEPSRILDAPDATEEDAGVSVAAAARAPLWRRLLKKYPYIRQHDETDCGAACMAMITAYYGSPVGVARMRDLANVDADGATMWSVAQAAETLGFHARGLQLSYEALQELDLPAIVHWEGYHYIVLWEASAKGVLVGDPGIALRRLSAEEFQRGWTGRALELIPTAKFGSTEKIKSPFRRFWPIVRPHSGLLVEVLGASLLLSILGLGIPLFTQTILDRVLVTGAADLLNILLLGMLGVAAFQALLTAVRRAILVHISTAANARLVSDFLRHVLSLPMKFFDLRRVGDVISRVGENDKIRAALVGTIPGVILDTVLALGYFGLMAFYNTSLMLVVLAVVPLFVILMVAFTPAIRRNRQEHFTKHADAWSTMIECFTGIGTVKATATEPAVRWKMESQFIDSVIVARKGARLETWSTTLATFLQTASAILFLWYGARQVMAGAMTVGQLLAFTTLAASVIAPILRLVDAWDVLQDVGNALDRLNDVFDAKPEEDGRGLLTLASLKGRITFDHVTFKYSSGQDKPTLAGITLDLVPGETVAVVGRSGSGKSTLAKLILGLYPPTKGRLMIDGHDLRTLNRRALRRRIGVVPQEVFLFSGTIRDNIALGDSDVTFDRVVEAARLAGAHEFITGMAMGYDTKVGERGMSMSGGQRQRIALARALLRKPDVLVLDEATSALDNESERAIQANLQEASRGRTTIVIAHRLSTVRNADRILVLDSGTVVEQGRHDELVEKAGLYASLVGQQVQE